MKLLFRYKGGKGSGFHGHAGRPGKRGGSTSANYVYHGTSKDNLISIMQNGLTPNKWGNPLNFHRIRSSAEYYSGDDGVLLRVNETDVKNYTDDTLTGRLFTQSSVLPDNIEIFVDGKWKKLSDYDTSR